MQSSVLAPSNEDQRSNLPKDVQSTNNQGDPMAAGAFTKTSYLKNPVFLQTTSSF